MAISKLPVQTTVNSAGHVAGHNATNTAVNSLIDIAALRENQFTGDADLLVFDRFDVVAGTATNTPIPGTAGTIQTTVISDNIIRQVWQSVTARYVGVYAARTRVSDVWQPWQISYPEHMQLQQLASDADLNSTFSQETAVVATTVTNRPSGMSGTGILEVFRWGGTSYLQRLTEIDSGNMYTRRYYSGAWTAWRMVAATSL